MAEDAVAAAQEQQESDGDAAACQPHGDWNTEHMSMNSALSLKAHCPDWLGLLNVGNQETDAVYLTGLFTNSPIIFILVLSNMLKKNYI